MKSVKGTRTEQNLLKSFAGESQARSRYTFFAEVARKEGYEQIAGVFMETAEQEREHAKRFFNFLEGGDLEITACYPAGKVGTTQENLLAAAMGEKEEWDMLYKEFAEVAKEEFETLTGSDWAQLLSEKPHIADKYDCYEAIDDIGISVTINYWAKLTAKQWCNLLIKQPQFANKCDKWEFFRYWDQESLLEKQPQLTKYFTDAKK